MTDLLPFFQLVAAFAALFLFGGLVLGIVRRPSAATVSVLVRGALIPAAAFAWYALFPGDLNPETPITWIGVSLLVAGLLLGARITISTRVGCSVVLGIAGAALGLKRSMRQTVASQQTSLAALKVLLASTT